MLGRRVVSSDNYQNKYRNCRYAPGRGAIRQTLKGKEVIER